MMTVEKNNNGNAAAADDDDDDDDDTDKPNILMVYITGLFHILLTSVMSTLD